MQDVSPLNQSKDLESLKKLEGGLVINAGKDLDWLDAELEGKQFLCGEEVTAADTMCIFSVQFIFARELCFGQKIGEWRNVERWVVECEGSEGSEGSEGWKRGRFEDWARDVILSFSLLHLRLCVLS